jgi:hypothetical protein
MAAKKQSGGKSKAGSKYPVAVPTRRSAAPTTKAPNKTAANKAAANKSAGNQKALAIASVIPAVKVAKVGASVTKAVSTKKDKILAVKPKKSNAVTPEQASKALAKARAEQKMADQMRQGIKAQAARNKAQVEAKMSMGAKESLRQAKVAGNKIKAAKNAEAAKVSKAAADFIKKEKAKRK